MGRRNNLNNEISKATFLSTTNCLTYWVSLWLKKTYTTLNSWRGNKKRGTLMLWDYAYLGREHALVSSGCLKNYHCMGDLNKSSSQFWRLRKPTSRCPLRGVYMAASLHPQITERGFWSLLFLRRILIASWGPPAS